MRARQTLALCTAVICYADQPPDWAPRWQIPSGNMQYIAKVSPKKVGNADKPWDWEYKVGMFYKSNPNKPIWQTSYNHTGYSGGFTSDDGKYFVYLEFWYRPNAPLIWVYSKTKTISLYAKDLNLLGLEFPKTVSHQLWLEKVIDTRFIVENGVTTGITVNTLHGPRQAKF